MTFRLRLSPDDPNTAAANDDRFQVGGDWEKYEGRRQTELFARSFHRYITVPEDCAVPRGLGCHAPR
jgi:hypothetical protein